MFTGEIRALARNSDWLESRLNDILIDQYAEGENAGYPTLCKGRFDINISGENRRYHALEEPTSLNTLEILPELFKANIASVKIEGRQRSPAYVEQVTKTWRAAIDAIKRTLKVTALNPLGMHA